MSQQVGGFESSKSCRDPWNSTATVSPIAFVLPVRGLFDALAARHGVDVAADGAALLGRLPKPAAERLLDVLCDHHVVVRPSADRYRVQDLVGTFVRSRLCRV
ncbi:MAG TPA: hypothetical protein VHV74_10250 [Pseudonocardiaceae bacterium]|jgi:hypothetical protein|nr:hypothetical protein [Pseudonocardiaceae bacterium]